MRNLATLFLVSILAGCSDFGQNTINRAIISDNPWPMHAVATGYNGADGVDVSTYNGTVNILSPWEQGGKVTVSSLHSAWYTTIVGTGNSFLGVEDAIFADVDSDGLMDVISANESNKRVVIHFQNSNGTWTNVNVQASVGVQRVMQVAYADMNGDGVGEILVGGKVMPATVGYYSSTSPRTATSWTYTTVSPASWIMSLIPFDVDSDGDMDIVVSDRDYIHSTPPNYAYTGERWLENPSWVNHEIGPRLSSHKFMDIKRLPNGNLSVIGGRSSASFNSIFRKTSTDNGSTWSTVELTVPGQLAQYHDTERGDLDLDGVEDTVYTASSADGSLSGVMWISGRTGQPYDISGVAGEKFDDALLFDMDNDGDLDIVTSEQTDQLGVVWYENTNSIPAPDAGVPDASIPDASVCCCPCTC